MEQNPIYDRQFIKHRRSLRYHIVAAFFTYWGLFKVRLLRHKLMDLDLPYSEWERISEAQNLLGERRLELSDILIPDDENVDAIITITEQMDSVAFFVVNILHFDKEFLEKMAEVMCVAETFQHLPSGNRAVSLGGMFQALALYTEGEISKEQCEADLRRLEVNLNLAKPMGAGFMTAVYQLFMEIFWQVYEDMYPPDQHITLTQWGELYDKEHF